MKLCDAILEFERTEYFVMCELEEHGDSAHHAIGYVWEGKGTTKCHSSYRLRHMNLMKAYIERETGVKLD
jgi:hypothetical protein